MRETFLGLIEAIDSKGAESFRRTIDEMTPHAGPHFHYEHDAIYPALAEIDRLQRSGSPEFWLGGFQETEMTRSADAVPIALEKDSVVSADGIRVATDNATVTLRVCRRTTETQRRGRRLVRFGVNIVIDQFELAG